MKINSSIQSFKEVHSLEEFLDQGYKLQHATIQNIDFTVTRINWNRLDLEGTTFLGCTLSKEDKVLLLEKGAIIFPKINDLTYNPFRSSMYSWQELYEETNPGRSSDLEIYEHFSTHKYAPSMMEALNQRIHDNSIDDALRDYLD